MTNSIERTELHHRQIDMRFFQRTDGLFEVEGRLLDRKTAFLFGACCTSTTFQPAQRCTTFWFAWSLTRVCWCTMQARHWPPHPLTSVAELPTRSRR